MSNKKQTALQWYIQQHDELAELSRNKTITISEILIRIKDIKKQALEMEREQIIDAYYYDPNCDEIKDDGEEYYEQIYEGQDER